MLTADQPVNVTAAHHDLQPADRARGIHGRRQLWQGADVDQGRRPSRSTRRRGNLTAKDTVRSVMRIETKTTAKPEATTADKAGPPRPRRPRARRAVRRRCGAAASRGPGRRDRAARRVARAGRAAGKGKPAVLASDTIATANELVYDDAERRARYTGTARMVGERGDLRGERIELFFDESGRGVSAARRLRQVRFSAQGAAGREPALGQRRPPHLLRRRGALRAERPARASWSSSSRAAVPRDDGPHADLLQLDRQLRSSTATTTAAR